MQQKKMRWYICRGAALLCTAILMVGCGKKTAVPEDFSVPESQVQSENEMVESESEMPEAESSVPDKTSESEPKTIALTKQIDGRDGRMHVMLPDNWSDLTGQMDDTGSVDASYAITAGCFEEAAFLLGNAEDRREVEVENASVYHQALTNAIAGNEAFSNVQVESAVEINTVKGGLHGYKSRFTADYENQSIFYVVYTLEDDSYFYQLSFWTTAADAAVEEPIFTAIADQFAVVG